MTKREVSTDWVQIRYDDGRKYTNEPEDKARPFTPMEALMQAVPGETPEVSQMENLALRDVIADAIDGLTERQRYVFEQHVMARVPLRTLAQWMGLKKSSIFKIKEAALESLRERLVDHPAVAAYLTRFDTEDDE